LFILTIFVDTKISRVDSTGSEMMLGEISKNWQKDWYQVFKDGNGTRAMKRRNYQLIHLKTWSCSRIFWGYFKRVVLHIKRADRCGSELINRISLFKKETKRKLLKAINRIIEENY
jgi:hypothetical protein